MLAEVLADPQSSRAADCGETWVSVAELGCALRSRNFLAIPVTAAWERASRNMDLSVYSQQRSCDSVQPRATAWRKP